MKRVARNSFAIAAFILGIGGTTQSLSGQPNNLKQDTRSIERPNPAWDYDGKRILGHVGQTVILWDAATGKLLQKLPGHKERIFAVRFSPDGVHAPVAAVQPGGDAQLPSERHPHLLLNLTTESKG